MKYIQERHDYEDCIFCCAAKEHDDEKNLIFYRGEHVFLILNRYPYTSGHVMCVPYDHQARLQDLTQAARYEMMDMVNRCIEVLQSLYHPDGFSGGLTLIIISAILFFAFGSFLGFESDFTQYWPVLLIALGLISLVRVAFSKSKR
jgi:hypothetical protein